MTNTVKIIALTLLFCSVSTLSFADTTPPKEVIEARKLVSEFHHKLRSALLEAIKTGGFVKAVETCHKVAPEVGKEVSQHSGWTVKRTSLKTRNPENIPTAEQKKILEYFASEQKQGKDIKTMEWWKKENGKFVYMKAIPTGGLCLTCHGSNVQPEIKQHIKKYYPNDMATGFKAGELRGAFVLEKKLQP